LTIIEYLSTFNGACNAAIVCLVAILMYMATTYYGLNYLILLGKLGDKIVKGIGRKINGSRRSIP